MKYKVLYILIIVFFINLTLHAQRGQRIAYIDTEYILQNVPEYQEANAQLDKKVLEWKSEIDKKLNVIATKKQELEAERILLTKELYEERLEDILIEENEVLDYQQKRFGPEGDYITQKNQLVQPIQDQIFATVQEIAETRNYDFIFDKSADLTMLFSAKQYDVSEFVLRSITRSATRKQAQTKAERQKADDEELVPEINNAKEERELALAERNAARAKEVEARRQKQLEEREAAKAAAEARRQQILEERAKAREAKSGKKPANTNRDSNEKEAGKSDENSQKSAKELMEEQRAQKLKEREALRKKALEARQSNNPPALEAQPEITDEPKVKTDSTKTKESSEAKKPVSSTDSTSVKAEKTPQQLMNEERQRKLKEREEQRQAVLNARKQQTETKDETPTEKTSDSTKTEKPMTAQEKIEAERLRKIEDREKRRKELEERKQKILEERKKQREQQEAEKKSDTVKNNN